MKMIPWSAFAVTLCLTLLGVAGCGDSGDGMDAASGKLSVYTGLPRDCGRSSLIIPGQHNNFNSHRL